MWAAAYGYDDILSALISANASLDAKDNVKYSMLAIFCLFVGMSERFERENVVFSYAYIYGIFFFVSVLFLLLFCFLFVNCNCLFVCLLV